jgi:hypothetical protein
MNIVTGKEAVRYSSNVLNIYKDFLYGGKDWSQARELYLRGV